MLTPRDAIHTYILAKDGNRPFLMKQAFAENAVLETVVKSDAISFPSAVEGLAAIEDVLVRRFCADNENVYTFCLSRPADTDRHFSCHWLVGMSMKATGQLRIGCGRYDWHFNGQGKIEKLVITIDLMKILPPDERDAAIGWLATLPYPWCSPAEALNGAPARDALAEIAQHLKRLASLPATP
jgi:hypothetical protein